MGAVRQPVVNRIRGPELVGFITRSTSDGLPFDKLLPAVDEKGLVLVSNKRLNRAHDERKLEHLSGALICHTGTHTCYVKPDTTFERAAIVVTELEEVAGTRYFIRYTDPQSRKHWLFPIPPDYLGKKDSILVTEHPDYAFILDRKTIITVPAGISLRDAVDLVEKFPRKNGHYPVDSKHNIPISLGGDQTFFLGRIDERVGPVDRGHKAPYEVNPFGRRDWQRTDLANEPSFKCGGIVEALTGE